jgi:hypothetical protein
MGVGPCDRQAEVAVERCRGQLARDAADGVGGNAAASADRIRCILRIEIAFGEQLEYRHDAAAVGQRVFADHGGRDIDRIGVGW